MVATGCAGGLTGVGLIAAFAAGLAFFGDARRAGTFFASFFLTFVVFLRVVASVGESAYDGKISHKCEKVRSITATKPKGAVGSRAPSPTRCGRAD